jgi:hypothetical protein
MTLFLIEKLMLYFLGDIVEPVPEVLLVEPVEPVP